MSKTEPLSSACTCLQAEYGIADCWSLTVADRLIKDVVTECDQFDVDKFIPLLRERIRVPNPFVRQLLVGWITVLDSVPDVSAASASASGASLSCCSAAAD